MKNNKFHLSALFILISLLFLLNTCKNEDVNPTNGRSAAVFNPDKIYNTVKDFDGNVYKTIKIGTQTWMAENLRTSHFRNGKLIPSVPNNESWSNLTTSALCNYNNTQSTDTMATFGRLYNWYAINDSSNIAPIGWHVPSDEEWSTLITYLGGEGTAGGKMEEAGIMHWRNINPVGNNSSGFTFLPGGFRYSDVRFVAFNEVGTLWSSSEFDTGNAYRLYLIYNDDYVFRYYMPKTCGLSIRCIKDE